VKNDPAPSDATYTSTQAQKHTEAAAYEGAIDYLDHRGLIDRDRVGILGFSRTVCYVGYALTHSKYHFSAGILVDGVDCGYFQYLTEGGGNADAESLNGGGQPWGKGLATWLDEAPGFALDRVNTPIRLEAHGKGYGDESLLSQWEWFSGLRTLGKPVDFILLPNADHLLVKPWERMVSQQGAVDWFSFWLEGEEDPHPSKTEQYKRWRELRKLQAETEKKTPVPVK
jgi:dipeptidyl aminopeptidase/acylaminoacyl peptidase